MKTLYLRNVPDDVATDLAALADRAGMSVNAFAVRELTQISRRARNAAILAELPDYGVSVEDIVAAVHADRTEH